MIGKIMKNSSFRATTGYVLGKDKAKIIGGNMVGETVDQLVAEFAMSKSLNPELERPVLHMAVSFSHADQETGKLTPHFKEMIALRHFAGMVVSSRQPNLLKGNDRTLLHQKIDAFLDDEIFNYQLCVVEHNDADHAHVHVIASCINLLDSKCINAWYERVRNKAICRDLERQYGLEQVPNQWWEVVRPTAIERQRIVDVAPTMAQSLENPKLSLVPEGYSLIRQGGTITYCREDDSIALKARQNKKGDWKATAGNLTEQEAQYWQSHQSPQESSVSPDVQPVVNTEPATGEGSTEETQGQDTAVQPALLITEPATVEDSTEEIQEHDTPLTTKLATAESGTKATQEQNTAIQPARTRPVANLQPARIAEPTRGQNTADISGGAANTDQSPQSKQLTERQLLAKKMVSLAARAYRAQGGKLKTKSGFFVSFDAPTNTYAIADGEGVLVTCKGKVSTPTSRLELRHLEQLQADLQLLQLPPATPSRPEPKPEPARKPLVKPEPAGEDRSDPNLKSEQSLAVRQQLADEMFLAVAKVYQQSGADFETQNGYFVRANAEALTLTIATQEGVLMTRKGKISTPSSHLELRHLEALQAGLKLPVKTHVQPASKPKSQGKKKDEGR